MVDLLGMGDVELSLVEGLWLIVAMIEVRGDICRQVDSSRRSKFGVTKA
jgi:hypothetical protein